MTWLQNYNPLGSLAASTVLAAVPVIVLLALLAFGHVRAHRAALAALLCALVLACGLYRMPLPLALAAAGYGAAFGLFPIGWIVVNAIFIYQLSVETGQFEALKMQISGLASDRRLQTLLIAFCFGAFIEGAAGFGAPVAITGALMIGLGFAPLEAAVLALIGNTAPVAFGSLGIPLVTLSKVTGLDLGALSAMTGRQLPLFSLLIPFWLIVVQAGWRGMLGVWPACLTAGLSFAVVQFAMSNFHGPWLVDLAAALASIGALLVLLKFWQPPGTRRASAAEQRAAHQWQWRPWLPWIALSALVFLWSVPAVKSGLEAISNLKWSVPGLDAAVVRVPPVVKEATAEPAVYVLNWLSATGTALLVAGFLAGGILGLGLGRMARLYLQTVWRVRVSLWTIALMLALGFTTRFSGSDATLGLAVAHTGLLFPFFSPLLGWLGVALTGSDTSSNVLFGNLQQVTAQQLGLPPILTTAANSAGGVMGKMIDAQSIVVASTAVGAPGERLPAGVILRRVFWHSLALALLVGCWIMMLAYLFPRLIPT